MIGSANTSAHHSQGDGGGSETRDGFLLAGAVAATVSFLPFLRMLLHHQAFYFRDLSGYFLPARRFLLDGLSQGEMRFWNPFTHEGTPMLLSPFGYLPDLLQLLVPNEFGISVFLALHIPMAAVSFTLLARELRLGPVAAVAGASIYALGGFSLSTINLYVYAQAMAWAPLFILAFRRGLELGGLQRVAMAALALAMMISTTGLEIAIQTCFLAVVLTPPNSTLRFRRAAASAVLGVALAAAVVMPMLAVSAGSERGAGFSTSVVLAHSIHPLTLFQILAAGFYGETSNLTGLWWGENFFPLGFPYILSLYLGPTVLALATVGMTVDRPLRRRITLVTLGALIVGLGRYAGWEAFVDLSTSLRFLRFPVKAFFMVQFSIALLASFGAQAIATGTVPHYLNRLAMVSIGLGGALVGTLFIPMIAPTWLTWFLNGFVPSQTTPLQRVQIGDFIVGDAAIGGVVAMVAGALCLMARRNVLAPPRAAAAVVALAIADLIRAGAGLNPTVTAKFYQLSPQMQHQVDLLRQSGGRVFTCDTEKSPSYWEGRRIRGVYHEAFSMATMQETLTPDFNLPFGVRTALSPDRTSLVSTRRLLDGERSSCSRVDLIVPALRAAGVTRVLSIEALTDPALRLLAEVTPTRIAPLRIRIYELIDDLSRFHPPVTIIRDNSDALEVEVVVDQPTHLTVRDPMAKGWRATVDGVEHSILATPDGHREISLPKGHSRVLMWYEPPGLRTGLRIALAAALVFLICLFAPLVRAAARVRAAGKARDPV